MLVAVSLTSLGWVVALTTADKECPLSVTTAAVITQPLSNPPAASLPSAGGGGGGGGGVSASVLSSPKLPVDEVKGLSLGVTLGGAEATELAAEAEVDPPEAPGGLWAPLEAEFNPMGGNSCSSITAVFYSFFPFLVAVRPCLGVSRGRLEGHILARFWEQPHYVVVALH